MSKSKNLIFFLSDNHARSMLGCYGHPIVHTPNLDWISETGVRFDNAYCASSLCCPSRAAIATGLYPHQTGYWDNGIVYDGKYPSWHGQLRDNGTTAVAIGKLHYLSGEIQQGFSDEIVTMHILGGLEISLVSCARQMRECQNVQASEKCMPNQVLVKRHIKIMIEMSQRAPLIGSRTRHRSKDNHGP